MITEEKVVTYQCDICKKKSGVKMASVGVPHYFLTEQTEGNFLKTPRLETLKMDLCKECVEKAVVVEGVGAQGYNQYRFRQHPKKYDEYEAKEKAFDAYHSIISKHIEQQYSHNKHEMVKRFVKIHDEYESGEYDAKK